MRTILATTLLLWIVTSALGAEHNHRHTTDCWVPPHYAKVVGYRFKLPSDDNIISPGPVPSSGFSLLTQTGVDIPKLDVLKIKSTELTCRQIRQLARAMNSRKISWQSACYDPHHIFVFYDAQDHPTGAVEVCFSCTGLYASPAPKRPLSDHYNIIALARLTDALGLWPDYLTLAKYTKKQRENERD